MSTTNKSKLYFRGTSRPEVFPIGRSCSKDSRIIKEINTGHDGNTVYSSKGLAVTQKALGGGQGGKGGIHKIKEATKKGYAEAGEGDSINFAVPNSKTRRGRVGNGVANTLDTACQQGTLEDMKIRRLTPTECERLQGFPSGWTEGISDTQRYKCLGNAVTVNVIEAIINQLTPSLPVRGIN